MQKKTFTRWANMSLSKKDQIKDLFEDFKSGTTLIKLINILSESRLRPERGLSIGLDGVKYKYHWEWDLNCNSFSS